MYKDGFVSSCKQSGALFDKTGYEALQSSLINMGEKQLFIEKVHECYDPQPLFLSLPVRLSWEELLSGGFIVSFLIDFPHGFFFLFGPSALWGLFIANDALFDVEILGVKSKYLSCFSPYYQYESSFEKWFHSRPPKVRGFSPGSGRVPSLWFPFSFRHFLTLVFVSLPMLIHCALSS